MATLWTVASEDTAGAAVLVPGTTYYASLHSATPGITGANEFTGGSYARQPVVFTAWAGGATGSTSGVTVPNAGTTAAEYVGLWSAATGGTYICGLAMGSPVTAASIVFAAGAIAPTVNG